jgi:hypothetical protein
MIDDYFRELLETVNASPVIGAHDIALEKRSDFIGYIRGDLPVRDGSRLHFREFVDTEHGVDRYMYAYQYQRADNSLIFRYDNTDHYPDLPNAPHHKHENSENNVISATAPDLAAVLKEIETLVGAE